MQIPSKCLTISTLPRLASKNICCPPLTRRNSFCSSILQEVLIVTKLNQPSKGDNGEVARAQRKLAEAYELKGVLHEATRLRTEAEAMRKEIQGPRFEELPDCDLSYAMMSFHACW